MQATSHHGGTHVRRQAVLAAASLSSLGVIALTMRESAPHPGRIGLSLLIAIGAITYVAPLSFFVDWAMRAGRTSIRTVTVVGVLTAIFLATRRVGSFSQVWPAFSATASIAAILAIDQVRRLVAVSPLRRSPR